MQSELGPEWRSLFHTFETIPMASASIGQVHYATLSPSSPFYPKDLPENSGPITLAVKIQFPNIQKSITSDIRTITTLLSRTTSFLPKGLFLGKTMEVFKVELADECNYEREAAAARRFDELLEGDTRFRVPKVIGLAGDVKEDGKLTTGKVLVMERMEGVPVGAAVKWEQEVRDEVSRCMSGKHAFTTAHSSTPQIAHNVLVLCFKELFEFRFMQTDPNWSNFLYNRNTRQVRFSTPLWRGVELIRSCQIDGTHRLRRFSGVLQGVHGQMVPPLQGCC